MLLRQEIKLHNNQQRSKSSSLLP